MEKWRGPYTPDTLYKNRFMGHQPKDEIIGGMAADPSFLPEVGGNITVPQVFFFHSTSLAASIVWKPGATGPEILRGGSGGCTVCKQPSMVFFSGVCFVSWGPSHPCRLATSWTSLKRPFGTSTTGSAWVPHSFSDQRCKDWSLLVAICSPGPWTYRMNFLGCKPPGFHRSLVTDASLRAGLLCSLHARAWRYRHAWRSLALSCIP